MGFRGDQKLSPELTRRTEKHSRHEKIIGAESDDPAARNVPIEVADVHIGSHKVSGKRLAELGAQLAGGVTVQALFRAGLELPLGPKTDVHFGDVVRLNGPGAAIQRAAKRLGGTAVLFTMKSGVLYLSLAMLVGYLVGVITVTISGILFAFGTSAGGDHGGRGGEQFPQPEPQFRRPRE